MTGIAMAADEAVTVAVGDDFAAFEKRRPAERFKQEDVPRDALIQQGYACPTYVFKEPYQTYFLDVCYGKETKKVDSILLTILPAAVDLPKIGRIMLSLKTFTLNGDGSFTLTTRP